MGSSRSYIDLYDLHLHTYWSYDATAHPENYFRRARELGLHCLAVADHHVLDSLDEVLKLAKEYPDIRTIPAAELTVTTSIGSVDLLCYGLPCNFPEELQKILDEYHAWQQEAGDAISRGLQVLGHDFTDAHRLELLQSYRPSRAIEVQGNTHVKNGLLRQYFLEHGFINKEEDYSALMTQVRKKVRAVMNKGAFYFAQLTDIHIGQGLNPTEAAANLAWALAELEAYSPEPEMILATADLVCAGKRSSCHSWCSLFPQLWRTIALCRNWHRQWQTQTAAG